MMSRLSKTSIIITVPFDAVRYECLSVSCDYGLEKSIREKRLPLKKLIQLQLYWNNFSLKNYMLTLFVNNCYSKSLLSLDVYAVPTHTSKMELFAKWTFFAWRLKAATECVLWKNVFLKISQTSQENTCAKVFFSMKLQASGQQLYLKKTLAQVFSCEFRKISKNAFFTEHLRATASGNSFLNIWLGLECASRVHVHYFSEIENKAIFFESGYW